MCVYLSLIIDISEGYEWLISYSPADRYKDRKQHLKLSKQLGPRYSPTQAALVKHQEFAE